jgi:hypothetical protein
MPIAPNLPPDQMAKAQANAGVNPVNFLIAAADMHNSGQLSAPVPKGKDLPSTMRRNPKRLQMVK